ncbi:hydrolase [Peribacillus alkalitolerans]|uniref:hydrolase n=1 Tax=Peribacillus alkalitolerans TaxID=1550385 RepID=UPI0013D11E6B|nr:hydrolase [Peribacillus alkalitolerans]
MNHGKRTYYIGVGDGLITQDPESSPWNFKIEASDDEITQLREYFDKNYANEQENFYRAHVPYIQYHFDRENDAYDKTLHKVYEMIHRLGDDTAKKHIESMGILKN